MPLIAPVFFLSYPSQSGKEIQPSSRYVTSGWDGMLEGRPAMRHAFHSSQFPNVIARTEARASSNGR